MPIRNGHEIAPELWLSFIEFADENGISTDNEQDWGPWFDAWEAGYDQGYSDGSSPF